MIRRLCPTLAVLLAASCSSTGLFYDPVFVSVGTPRHSTTACPTGSTCVEVPLTALAEATGSSGRCELYTTPGDPDAMQPLASEVVEVPAADGDGPEISFTWETTIATAVEPADLNPVCEPMVEG